MNQRTGLMGGLATPLRALRFSVGHPSLWLFMLMPMTISVLFFGAMGWVLYHFSVDIKGAIVDSLPKFLGPFLAWIAMGLVWFVAAILAYFGFSLVGNVLASPFNDVLAKKVLRLRGFEIREEDGLVRGAFRAMRETASMSLFKLVAMLLLLIPGLQPLSLIWLPLFIGIDFYDYPWSYLRRGTLKKLGRLKVDGPNFIGFAAAFALLFSVPLVSLLLLPFAVVGACLNVRLEETGVQIKKAPARSV